MLCRILDVMGSDLGQKHVTTYRTKETMQLAIRRKLATGYGPDRQARFAREATELLEMEEGKETSKPRRVTRADPGSMDA